MNLFLMVLGALLLLFTGCAGSKIKPQSAIYSSPCFDRPSFCVSFFQESFNDPYIRITETNGVPKILVAMHGNEKIIINTAEFNRIKTLILKSKQWRTNAREARCTGVWCGSPRDILTITSENLDATFQANRVPAEWKKRIKTLADHETSKSIGDK